MSPEGRFLLACARTRLGAAHRERIVEACEAGIDWGALKALAVRHSLAPLVDRHLASAAGFVPKPVLAWFWARHQAIAKRNGEMAAELAALVADLNEAGLRVVPYKGPTLALAAYGELSLREFGDLDLLVCAREAPRIRARLESRGYRCEYPLTPALEAALVRSRRHYELPLRDTGRGFLVELHWRSDPQYEAVRTSDPAWWATLGRARIEGVPIPELPDVDLMLVLCLHGAKHAWQNLSWLVDVAELVGRKPGLDWTAIVEKARAMGAARRIALGLLLANLLLDMEMPTAIAALAEERAVVRRAREIASGLLDPVERRVGMWRLLADEVRLHDRPLAGLGYLIRTAVAPGLGDWTRWRLPPSLFPLYWLLRPVRLAGKYLLRLR